MIVENKQTSQNFDGKSALSVCYATSYTRNRWKNIRYSNLFQHPLNQRWSERMIFYSIELQTEHFVVCITGLCVEFLFYLILLNSPTPTLSLQSSGYVDVLRNRSNWHLPRILTCCMFHHMIYKDLCCSSWRTAYSAVACCVLLHPEAQSSLIQWIIKTSLSFIVCCNVERIWKISKCAILQPEGVFKLRKSLMRIIWIPFVGIYICQWNLCVNT